MAKRAGSKRYHNLNPSFNDENATAAWYWRFIALAASWMILSGYLILPGLYTAGESKLKFSQSVLSVFVVALLTAGYSFTALLCFACRDHQFQAESIFLPTLTSSALGVLTVAYNFLASNAYEWNTAAISATVISTTSTLLYAILLLWTQRSINKAKEAAASRSNLWSEQSYYQNYVANMYPSSRSPCAGPDLPNPQPCEITLTEDDRINQQMALLLMKKDPVPCPEACSATFRIDLPEDSEMAGRIANSQELVGTPPQAAGQHEWNDRRPRGNSRPDSLSEQQAWRGRAPDRPSSVGSDQSRGKSREERRREIELGHVYR